MDRSPVIRIAAGDELDKIIVLKEMVSKRTCVAG
jgi:hypothetical protein